MCAMTDPRAAVEFRVPAMDLRPGDLVNTTPGEDDWQAVVGVFRKPADARSDEIRTLVESVTGRYVVVQLTDLAPVDGGVYFNSDGVAMIYGDDEADDETVADVVSSEDGIRTYLFTRFELVSVRAGSS
jgi:ketosteroid isomerase-like protein